MSEQAELDNAAGSLAIECIPVLAETILSIQSPEKKRRLVSILVKTIDLAERSDNSQEVMDGIREHIQQWQAKA